MRLDDGSLIILDAGTGIRPLGNTLCAGKSTILLSHYHWDHIQGLPFFGPGYAPESEIQVFGPEFNGEGPEEFLSGQMMTPYFPAAPSQMRGIREFSLTPNEPFRIGSAVISAARLSHPGTTLGYRIEEAGTSFVYMSDDEPDLASSGLFEGIIALAAGADVLLHDCQFTEGEYEARRGWGHSTPRQALKIASEAGAHCLVHFHHDPAHDDEQVEAMAEEARQMAGSVEIIIGRECAAIEPRRIPSTRHVA